MTNKPRTYTKRGRPITEPLTVLKRARDLLASGGTWCQGPFATGLKRNGAPDKFCAIGALREVANMRWKYLGGGAYHPDTWSIDTPDAVVVAQQILESASEEMHGTFAANFSDHHAKNVGEVVKVYDRAIEMAKEDKRDMKLVSA